MSPLNRGPLLGPRMPPVGMRAPLPRFGGRLPMPGMPPRMPPPMGPMFGPMRQRMMPPRPGPGMMRPGGPHPPPPLFGPRPRGVLPIMPPIMGPRGMGPRGPLIRPGPRGPMPPQGLPHMRVRFPIGNGNVKAKSIANAKKVNKLEELELKKPWMTDEIRSEIQKKNKLYAKAKKNKDAKEWDEFKDLRNKVTRMIRDAKNDYLAKHPEQAHIYQTADEEQPYDLRDENNVSSEEEEQEDTSLYCEVCDREFLTAQLLERHVETHTTCGIDGCVFSAHPKLVEKHISMQHCTGLYHRMKNLSTPEDIEKWIAERKKKYPTKSNINQKNAVENEKRERGEIIGRKHSTAGSKHSDKPVKEKRRKLRKRKTQDFKPEPETVTELYRGLRPFAGTANLPQYTDEEDCCEDTVLDPLVNPETVAASLDPECNISDEEEETPLRYEKTEPPPVSAASEPKPIEKLSCFGSLVADYGSDSNDDDAPVEIPIKRIKTELPVEEASLRVPSPSAEESTNHSKENTPEIVNPKSNNVKNSKSIKERRRDNSREDKSNKKNHENIKNPRNTRNNKRLMLLQRLLARSMQHERNLVCQCIKYIADNNFLQ